MEYIVKILISLSPVVLFFTFYFRNFIFQRSILLQTRAFFLGVLSATITILIILLLPKTSSPEVRAFIYAALLEELVRYVIIFIRVRYSEGSFTVTEGVFDGILVGLGFAFMENLNYSVNYSGFTVLLRCVSSVPMHVFASGIMAYFVSYSQVCEDWKFSDGFNRIAKRHAFLLTIGLLVPWLFHGLYDYALFTGGVWNYFICPLLILGFAGLEYFISRGRLVLGKNILQMIGIGADEMDIIQKEQEYEKWMHDFQKKAGENVNLFKNEWSLFNTITGAVLVAFATTMFSFLFWNPDLILKDESIPIEAKFSLLVWLPFSMGLILVLSDKINYLYFREYMLRQPEGNPVTIKQGDIEMDQIVLDIFAGGVFLPGVDMFDTGSQLTLEFYQENAGKAPVSGSIHWINRHSAELPRGSLFRFEGSSREFDRFLFKHKWRKIWNRVRLSFFGKKQDNYVMFWE